MESKIFNVVLNLEVFTASNEQEVQLEVQEVIERLDGFGIKKIEVKEYAK